MKKLFSQSLLAAVALVAFVCMAVHVTAGERHLSQSQTYGISPTDKVSFHGAAPIPMASAAAQATVTPTASATVAASATPTITPAAPAATASPTAIPTITPTDTPVGSTVNPTITKVNQAP